MEILTKEITECPNCGSDDLHNRWTSGRKLQRGCNSCSWKETPRVPETKEIKDTKFISVDQFYGFVYEIYDKYGYIIIYSKTYRTSKEAKEAIIEELAKLNKSPIYAPCTGILWPDKVEVSGEVFV
jgi:hypothetical protein